MSWLFAPVLRRFVLLACATSLLLNLALLVPAIYMTQVFDRVFASRSVETLVMLSVFAALALALGYAMDALRARTLAFAGGALERRLAPAALGELLRQAAGVSMRGSADADTLRDVSQLRAFLGGHAIQALLDAPWLPIHLLVITLMHPLLGAISTLGAALLFALGVLTERLTHAPAEDVLRRSRGAQRRAEALSRNAEAIVGMGMGRAAVALWRSGHDALMDAQWQLAARTSRLGALARMLRQALQVLVLALGAWLVIDAGASPGIMVAATILLGRALQPVEFLIAGWKQQLEARGAWRRLAERRLSDVDAGVTLPAPSGRLRVERITFGHDKQRPALIKQVQFALEPGESLGLVGPSASGKTTLVRLLLGIWRPQGGTVRLDGADIARWNRDHLGAHVGYLPQDVELFGGTVAGNIARLGHADTARVIDAARLAHAHEMILRLPQGYDTPIGDGGALLSGGQRQRIGLARALYGAPKLVVLDEPNANLDAEGDEALRAALQTLKARGTTVIVVSHRLALMSQLDKLAVLKEGALVAFGATAKLLPVLLTATTTLSSKRLTAAPAVTGAGAA